MVAGEGSGSADSCVILGTVDASGGVDGSRLTELVASTSLATDAMLTAPDLFAAEVAFLRGGGS